MRSFPLSSCSKSTVCKGQALPLVGAVCVMGIVVSGAFVTGIVVGEAFVTEIVVGGVPHPGTKNGCK